VDLPPLTVCASRPREGAVRIIVRGELDHLTHSRLVQVVAQSCDGCEDMVIDLTDVTFIDGGGLSALATASALCGGAKVDLRVDGEPPLLTRLLDLTGLDLPRSGDHRRAEATDGPGQEP